MNTEIELYFHPTCATSHEIIMSLYEKGYLDNIKLHNTLAPLENNFIWSVPWLIVNKEPVGTDPITSEEIIEIIENKKIDINDPKESFMMSILHSSYASSISILHKDLQPVINNSFIKASIRYGFSNIELNEFKSQIIKIKENLFEEYRDKIRRALAVSFVRELYWSKSGKIDYNEIVNYSNEIIVGLWLLSKASIGRVGLISKPYIYGDIDIKEISEFVSKRGKGLLEKIKEEQDAIYNDKKYWEIIKNY
ncbi:putative thioredoxin/glutaredoxin [Caldisphaera lagunensis DSM 15908]|uniref:Putative thioredoxin/glutaredoxin n=1 Tax=Caldisphaera lagunensis (strain DSM 15908 / JCM 11604 / ANMR 0165 / IC-154) TaxID=1056495 RepID=L0AAI3_CALLD|nr:thioredoxin/glutaredoxin [Caldisphaera lagunensis]AFZ70102.1 putative thioredoxin/glutaredoxin [Caldisphaera lagunensis DSM 15908]